MTRVADGRKLILIALLIRSFDLFYFCFLASLGDEITSFGNISALSGNVSATNSNKRKHKGKGRGGKKRAGGKKRKLH